MLVGILEGIGAAWEFITGIFEPVLNILNKFKWIRRIMCALETYAWLQQLKFVLNLIKNLGFSIDDILEMAGIDISGFGATTGKGLMSAIRDTQGSLQKELNNAQEIQRRLQMSPSSLAGTHKPNYDSTVFIEVNYSFDNLTGTGMAILFFNPIGFGGKIKSPEIIRYIGEQEFGKFISSKSWGNYWRLNFLKNRPKHFNTYEKDVITGESFPSPKSESLENYVERVMEFPDDKKDLISGVFQDEISEALGRHEDISKRFVESMEKGTWGREFTSHGFRATDIAGRKIRNVPKNLENIVGTNPVFKEIIGLTAAGKKAIQKIRTIRQAFSSVLFKKNLSAEAEALSGAYGAIAESLAFVDMLPKGAIQEFEAGGTKLLKKYISSARDAGVIGSTADDFLSYMTNNVQSIMNTASLHLSISNEIARDNIKGFDDMSTIEKMFRKRQWEEATGNNINKMASEKMKGLIERDATSGFLKGAFKGMLTPPKCLATIWT